MVYEAKRRRRGRATALGLAVALVAGLVVGLLQVVASAGPASAADWSVTLRLTKTDAHKLNLRADSSRNLVGSGLTLAIWDTTTGARQAVCNDGVTACGGTPVAGYSSTSVTTVPSASTTELSSAAHEYVATLSPTATTTDVYPADAVATSAPQTAGTWTVSLTRTVLNSKQVQLTAAAGYSVPGSGYTLAILDRTTGQLLKACNSGETPCDGTTTTGYYFTRVTVVPRATSSELSAVPHEYVAIVAGGVDALPGDNLAATSPVVTLDQWKVTLAVSQTTGRAVQLTATANYNIANTGYTLAIFDRTTGAAVKTCGPAENPCGGSASIGYYWTRVTLTPRGSTDAESGAPHDYVAVLAQDVTALPGDNVAATSDPVTALPWSVSLTTATPDGRSFSLTAQSSYTLADSGYTLSVYDETTGERVGVCGPGYAACSSTTTASNYWLRVTRSTGWGDSYVAVVSDDTSTLPASNVAARSGSVVPS